MVAQLTTRGAAFNGVHLRVEADANFQTYADGAEVCAVLFLKSNAIIYLFSKSLSLRG